MTECTPASVNVSRGSPGLGGTGSNFTVLLLRMTTKIQAQRRPNARAFACLVVH